MLQSPPSIVRYGSFCEASVGDGDILIASQSLGSLSSLELTGKVIFLPAAVQFHQRHMSHNPA